MFHGEDFDRTRPWREEEYTIIPNPEPQVSAQWTKLLNFADAGGQIIVDGVQDAEGGLAIDRRNLGPSVGRPNDYLVGP